VEKQYSSLKSFFSIIFFSRFIFLGSFHPFTKGDSAYEFTVQINFVYFTTIFYTIPINFFLQLNQVVG